MHIFKNYKFKTIEIAAKTIKTKALIDFFSPKHNHLPAK